MTRIAQSRPSHAFTLVEVICALVIFGVALVGFMQNIATASRTQADLYDEQRALMLVQNILEEMRYSGAYEIGVEEGVFNPPDNRFMWETMIDDDPNTEGLVMVTATVRWFNGGERETALTTLISKADMLARGASSVPTGTGSGASGDNAGGGAQ